VLLTADDLGGSRDAEKMLGRARQNVIFELGFFFGTLGREFVAVLHEENVELPTDIHGLVYIPIDSQGAWRTKLAKELTDAGFQIDAQKAL
jgi:predicted nucleotide-binding protein